MTERARPFPRVRAAPFADREHDRPASRMQGVRPLRVERSWAQPVGVTPVDLHVIDAPLGEPSRVTELIAEARGEVHAGHRSGVGVDAEAQPQGMYALGYMRDPTREP